jgi:hypothetical protein
MVMNGPKFSDVLVSYITFSQAALAYPLLLHSQSKTCVKNVASLVESEFGFELVQMGLLAFGFGLI